MALRELYHPKSGRMRVAGFMSGSGSNLRKIIENQGRLEARDCRSPYQVVVIFSNDLTSNAQKIGGEYGIPVIESDMARFHAERGRPKNDLSVRAEFDARTVEALKPFDVDVAAYAGYMAIATHPLINAFLGVNVHPADLSIMTGQKRKYTGANAVRDAILAGETQLRSTTHLIEREVDYGKILMVSYPTAVQLPKGFDRENKDQVKAVVDAHQDNLKRVGDWVIFPRTLEYIADGRYSKDEKGNIHFDDKPIPQGLRLEAA